jgi:hypothetical protein
MSVAGSAWDSVEVDVWGHSPPGLAPSSYEMSHVKVRGGVGTYRALLSPCVK